MLRKLLKPRLWWLLVLPVAFYLTRKANLPTPGGGMLVSTQFAESVAIPQNMIYISHYEVLGIRLSWPLYNGMTYIMKACIVIGCLSLVKGLFLSKPSPKSNN